MACPQCAQPMASVYIVLNGGAWLSESRAVMKNHIALHLGEVHLQDRSQPHICVLPNSGYRVGTWPKEGLYCEACGCMVIKTSPT